MRYVPSYELERTVGIEVSFIPGWLGDADRHDVNYVCERLVSVFRRRLEARKARFNRVYNDPMCVEIPTHVIKTRRDLKKTLEAYYDAADSLGMVGYADWHLGGGAHIHVGRKPGETGDDLFTTTMYCDLSNRPYISWAFMAYADEDRNAAPVCTNTRNAGFYNAEGKRIVESAALQKLWRRRNDPDATTQQRLRAMRELVAIRKVNPVKQVTPGQARNAVSFAHFNGNKAFAVVPRDKGGAETFEWRCFRAPGSVEGHIRHVNFVMAYMEHIERLTVDGVIPVPFKASVEEARKAFPVERSVKEFKKLLKLIGLSVRDYRDDIQNLRNYFAWSVRDKGRPRVDSYVIECNKAASRARREERAQERAKIRAQERAMWEAYKLNPGPMLYPETLEQCEGAHKDKESGIRREDVATVLKLHDRVRYEYSTDRGRLHESYIYSHDAADSFLPWSVYGSLWFGPDGLHRGGPDGWYARIVEINGTPVID